MIARPLPSDVAAERALLGAAPGSRLAAGSTTSGGVGTRSATGFALSLAT